MSITVNLLEALGREDVGEDFEIQPGDLLHVKAHTGVRFLPDVFEEDSFATLERWVGEVQETLRRNAIHTTVISLDAEEDADERLRMRVELQVTFAGDLPFQGITGQDWYGYDAQGNPMTRDEFYDHALTGGNLEGGLVAATGSVGPAGWLRAALILAGVLGATLVVDDVRVVVERATSEEASRPIGQAADAVKVVAVAAAIIALVYLLAKPSSP